MRSQTGVLTGTEAIKGPIAIIGGGFSGAALAWHLRKKGVTAEVVVIEPHANIGCGLAYGTADSAHRINVPATRMIIDDYDTEHFHRWLTDTGYLATDRRAAMPDGRLFPPREAFCCYVAEQVRSLSLSISPSAVQGRQCLGNYRRLSHHLQRWRDYRCRHDGARGLSYASRRACLPPIAMLPSPFLSRPMEPESAALVVAG